MNRERRLRTFLIDTTNPDKSGVTVRVKAYTVAEAKEKVRKASHGHAKIFGVREP